MSVFNFKEILDDYDMFLLNYNYPSYTLELLSHG